jgi:glycolate oxidase FAD binding subunit
VFSAAAKVDGYASCYTGHELRLPPLSAGQLKLHRNLKQAFDPKGIINPGRQYPDL